MPHLDDRLLAGLARAHEGDPDAAEEVFDDDVTYVDETDGIEVRGVDELLGHLAALGGRRERFLVRAVEEEDEEVVRLDYDLCFQADAAAYAQRGSAWLRLTDGRVGNWRCRWREVEIDRGVWD